VVQSLCGILLGPGVPGSAFPAYYDFVFQPDVIRMLDGVATWAVMIFVWIAGIELDLRSVWHNRGETGLTAGLALVTPLLFGCGGAWIMLLSGQGWIGPNAAPWQLRHVLRRGRSADPRGASRKARLAAPAARPAGAALCQP
jgi:hypothetical protein